MRRSRTEPIPSDSAQSNEEKVRPFRNCLAHLKIRRVLYTGDLNITDMNGPRQINLIVNHPDNGHFKAGACLRQEEKRCQITVQRKRSAVQRGVGMSTCGAQGSDCPNQR